jgi:hypothetical protein
MNEITLLLDGENINFQQAIIEDLFFDHLNGTPGKRNYEVVYLSENKKLMIIGPIYPGGPTGFHISSNGKPIAIPSDRFIIVITDPIEVQQFIDNQFKEMENKRHEQDEKHNHRRD